jgi:Winged helix-turn helix
MVFEGQAPYLWWETKRRVSTPSMLSVDYDRWGQTPEDLRQLATSAAHQRTRERFLALYEVTQASCATQVAARTRRHPQTVMEWLHLYNTRGPEALAYRRTGGRPPFAQRSRPVLGGSFVSPGMSRRRRR